jgi:hypothetical protein
MYSQNAPPLSRLALAWNAIEPPRARTDRPVALVPTVPFARKRIERIGKTSGDLHSTRGTNLAVTLRMKQSMVVGAVFAVLGCGSSASDNGNQSSGAGQSATSGGHGGAGGSAGQDTSSGDSAGMGDGSQGCAVALSELAPGCVATFDGSAAQTTTATCASYSPTACDDLLWFEQGGLGGILCAYDATTHALVGARAYNDVPTYCNETAFEETAGRLPSQGCVASEADCGEAGAAGAASVQ